MNFKHLHYFWVAAKAGGIVRAGQQLHTSPQTLSGQIKLLEERLGRKLFRKRGRQLELTDDGRVALAYADEIFALGGELETSLRGAKGAPQTLDFRVGVADSVPKSLACRLLEPGLQVPEPVRLICHEGKFQDLLAQLAVHRLDLVLADEPLPRQVGVKAFNHALGSTPMSFLGTPELRATLKGRFPLCLNGAPLLVQGAASAIRHRLDDWLVKHQLQPRIVGEFDDPALMKAFGRSGRGVFLSPTVLEAETQAQYGVTVLGRTDELVEEFYAISPERRISHPCVAAIAGAARDQLFHAELGAVERWFAGAGWQPFAFQREVWAAMAAGRSGLLHATTGSGKTYAVWIGALLRAAAVAAAAPPPASRTAAPPLSVMWLTPMRALAADTARALAQPLPALAPTWTVGMRTGDTPGAERARQGRRMPSALVTTPESLSLMLSRESAREDLAQVRCVIVDEWHELMGNKRGVQAQLAIARLRRWNPQLVVWGLSATLGNLDEAMQVLTGPAPAGSAAAAAPLRVEGRIDKQLVIDTLIPHDPGRFSWAGHLGAQMLQPVVDEIERSTTTLVFTNTRSQAEAWYQLLLQQRPDWAGVVALHHGSLDREVREWVEAGLKSGRLKAVVATSSLDLGVDFLPVERVLQIGSAKGVARLLQRGGRSGHAPGRQSRITLVPTNTLELVEAAAARRAAQAGQIEKRAAPEKPLDVLVQHLVTVALGGGFRADELFAELRTTHAYRKLSRTEFDWALAFVEKGGESLHAYPEYHRVQRERGVFRVPDRQIARRHRLQVGTIVSEASMQVSYLSGGRIGTIEEGFIARLRAGDCFVFAGRVLEFIRSREMTAYVKKAEKHKAAVPAWSGGRMPLSSEMADAVLELLGGAAQGDFFEPEMQVARPMLEAQARLSHLPAPGTLLIEQYVSREGHHLTLYPFAGRNVHMGLASLLAWRLARGAPNTFSLSVNDYGFELLSALPIDIAGVLDRRLLSPAGLMADMLQSLNAGQLAQRRFREIARVAGLVTTGYPGAPRSTRQLQASSSLFFEVFRKHDAGNRLLGQAETEALAQELELPRLAAALQRVQRLRIDAVTLAVPSPFSLPLMVERFREKLTTEKLNERLARILAEMSRAADPAALPAAARARGSSDPTMTPKAS